MSDEEPIIDDEIVSDDEPVSDDTTSTDTTSSDDTLTPTPSPIPGAYCTCTDVNSLFGDISDDVTEELFITSINNSTAWINANLTKRYVPIPVVDVTVNTEIPVSEDTTVSIETGSGLNIGPDSDITVLKTAAIYYAASDIILSLYHGDELPVQYDVWFQKAQTFLEAYIDAYLNSEASEDDLLKHQVVGHSKSMTYRQKRMYRSPGRW